MRLFTAKKVILLSLVLNLFGFSFFAVGIASAQTLTSSQDIAITARVSGCGDGIVQVSLAEQCEGPNQSIPDLNGQSCSSIGFDSGALSCNNSCTFDTSACSNKSGSSSSSSTSSRKRVEKITESVRETNLVFTGTAGAGDTIIVLNKGVFFSSGTALENGNFSIALTEPKSGDYEFSFYASSDIYGKSESEDFDIFVAHKMTTQINNIHLVYPDQEIQIPIIIDPIDEEGTELVRREVKHPLYNVLVIELSAEPYSPVPYALSFGSGFAIILLLRFALFILRFFIKI